MSINNPYVVINSLAATIIKHENTIEDLRAKLKSNDSVLAVDYKKLVEQLAQAKEAADNRPKYDYPVHEHPSFIESQKQTERANERIAELENQLSAERCAASFLRSYFIKYNKDAIAHLCDSVIDLVSSSDRAIRFKAGILALSPINHAFTGGGIAVRTAEAMNKIRAMESEQ